jgi:regulator of replication initiation timing
MDKQEIKRKADELNATLLKYKSELGALEKELLKAVADYHDRLKEEKLKEIKGSILQTG